VVVRDGCQKEREMMKKVPVLAVILVLGPLWAPQLEGASCSKKLKFDETYSCEFKFEAAAEVVEGTLTFSDLGDSLFASALQIGGDEDTSTEGVCSCKTRGSFQSVKFNAARGFYCVTSFTGDDGQGGAEVVEGKVSGNARKIKQGQIWSVDSSLVPLRARFFCEIDKSDNGDD
jgi:hypothetical protein